MVVRIPRQLNTYGSKDDFSPLQFQIEPSKDFELIGESQVPRGDLKSSKAGLRFYLTGEFRIQQRIRRLSGKPSVVKGSVTMVLCQRQLCRPPKDFAFEVSLPAAKRQATAKPSKLASKSAPSTESSPADREDEKRTSPFDPNEPFEWQSLERTLMDSVVRARNATVGIVYEGMGSATGVIVSPSGLVLTAGHCVQESGTEFKIHLNDKRSLPAVGLGMEPTYDCGMIQIDKDSLEGESLPWAEIGSALDLKKNVPVFSLGHGGGYDPVRGAYLRLGRVLEACSSNSGFIKSSALMEPGDSGGPLFNIHGQVVGIHSMIDQSLDANFDVPVDLFQHYHADLQQPGRFRWHKSDTKPDFALQLVRGRNRMTSDAVDSVRRGIRISRVASDGWADSQGLKKSDRVMKWEHIPLADPPATEPADDSRLPPTRFIGPRDRETRR